MKIIRFDIPVTAKAPTAGASQLVTSAEEASAYLLGSWSGKRGPKHREALQACHDAIGGGKPAMIARRAFVAALREGDLLVTDKAPA